MQKYNLKPCSFCSNRAMLEQKPISWIVVCNECRCTTRHFQRKNEAVEAWNIRAQTLDDVQKLNSEQSNVQKLKNERGAGRKPKLSEHEKKQIINLNYLPIRYLAKEFNVSVGTVHKIIAEQKKIVTKVCAEVM